MIERVFKTLPIAVLTRYQGWKWKWEDVSGGGVQYKYDHGAAQRKEVHGTFFLRTHAGRYLCHYSSQLYIYPYCYLEHLDWLLYALLLVSIITPQHFDICSRRVCLFVYLYVCKECAFQSIFGNGSTLLSSREALAVVSSLLVLDHLGKWIQWLHSCSLLLYLPVLQYLYTACFQTELFIASVLFFAAGNFR